MPSESPKATSLRTRVALDRVAEDDHQIGFGLQLVAQRFDARQFPALLHANAGRGLLVLAHRTGGDGVNVRAVMADIGAAW